MDINGELQPYQHTGYFFRNTEIYGMVDVLDWAKNVIRVGLPYGKAAELVTKWTTGTENPYLDLH